MPATSLVVFVVSSDLDTLLGFAEPQGYVVRAPSYPPGPQRLLLPLHGMRQHQRLQLVANKR
jgi:hypothetical protein